jgi:hypothetical protein
MPSIFLEVIIKPRVVQQVTYTNALLWIYNQHGSQQMLTFLRDRFHNMELHFFIVSKLLNKLLEIPRKLGKQKYIQSNAKAPYIKVRKHKDGIGDSIGDSMSTL